MPRSLFETWHELIKSDMDWVGDREELGQALRDGALVLVP
jgi:hypothetical protein